MNDAKEWYVARGSERVGPLTRSELASAFQSGENSPESLVFKQGMSGWTAASQVVELRDLLAAGAPLPWCTTPIEAESSLGPDSHHPIISLSGIPSAVMVLRILHPILASTLCAANPLARIAEPTIAL